MNSYATLAKHDVSQLKIVSSPSYDEAIIEMRFRMHKHAVAAGDDLHNSTSSIRFIVVICMPDKFRQNIQIPRHHHSIMKASVTCLSSARTSKDMSVISSEHWVQILSACHSSPKLPYAARDYWQGGVQIWTHAFHSIWSHCPDKNSSRSYCVLTISGSPDDIVWNLLVVKYQSSEVINLTSEFISFPLCKW